MNCLGDAATGATYGAGIGALLEGMAVSFDESLLRQSSTGAVTAIGTRVATSATRVGLVMGTFGAARCLVASIRDRDDFLNNMWGGLAAGSLIGVLAPVRAGGPKALAQGVYGAVGVATMGVGAYFLAATRSDIGDGATPTPPVLPVKHHPGT